MAEASRAAGLSSARESLRSSTKWIANGAALAAASVFFGSSVANLGALDPAENEPRFWIALAGWLVALVTLGLLFMRAISVLTIDSLNLRMLAADQQSADPQDAEMHSLADEIVELHRSSPYFFGATSLDEWLETTGRFDRRSKEALQADEFGTLLTEHASFRLVRRRFERLRRTVPIAGVLAILAGFAFLWAANPASERAEAEHGTLERGFNFEFDVAPNQCCCPDRRRHRS